MHTQALINRLFPKYIDLAEQDVKPAVYSGPSQTKAERYHSSNQIGR